MIRSCIAVSYLAVIVALGDRPALSAAQSSPADPDSLYRDRERPESAAAAERIWADRLAADPADVESATKAARVRYWLGTTGPAAADEKKRILERGIAAARAAAAARPGAPDGHFWMAANMGALADAHGLRQGLNTARRSATRSRRPGESIRRFSTGRRIGRSAAGTNKVPGSSAAIWTSRNDTCARHSPTSQTV